MQPRHQAAFPGSATGSTINVSGLAVDLDHQILLMTVRSVAKACSTAAAPRPRSFAAC